jgi:hypothetical protein
MILSADGADAMLAGNFATSCNNGYIRIYSGTVPTATATAPSGLLSGDGRLGATAFGAPAAGTNVRRITANAMTSDSAADAGGTATYFRVFKSDGTTVMFQGTVGAVASGMEMEIDTVPVIQGAPVNFNSLIVEMSIT